MTDRQERARKLATEMTDLTAACDGHDECLESTPCGLPLCQMAIDLLERALAEEAGYHPEPHIIVCPDCGSNRIV